MKRKASKKKISRAVHAPFPEAVDPPGAVANRFVRGFLAAGLIAATGSLQGRKKEVLRLALQSGAAMAAGYAGANALDRRAYGSALLAVAAGAASLYAINGLFSNSSPCFVEVHDEQEKA